MIVSILDGRVAPPIIASSRSVIVAVLVRSSIAVLVGSRIAVLVRSSIAVFVGSRITVFIRPVLRMQSSRTCSCQRNRDDD